VNRHFRRLTMLLGSLVLMLGTLALGVTPAFAAPSTSTAPTSIVAQSSVPPSNLTSLDQFGSPHITPAEAAYAAAKRQLSNEYNNMTQGKISQATFEADMTAFMVKYHLGNSANLHNVLMRSQQNGLKAPAVSPACVAVAPQTTGPSAVTPNSCPVYKKQFPEYNYNWCGPATLSTTLVEDSFAWPNTNSTSYPQNFTLSYDPYNISQPLNLADDDEYWLASNGVISGDIYNNGTSADQMLTMINYFVENKGGQYAEDWNSGNFQNEVATDIGSGWDVPDGIRIPSVDYDTLPGYPHFLGFDHWIPITYISSDKATVYYSDPIYNAPAYTPPASYSWNVPSPYEYTSTSNMQQYTVVFLW
jgi:hypothetical protein